MLNLPPARLTSSAAEQHLGAAAGLPAYAELFCLSNFSFLQGASHAEELVDRAVQLGYTALALTDECSLAGVVRAHAEAKRANLPFIVGAHFHLQHPDGSRALSILLLAQNRNGYGNLAEMITLGRTRSGKGSYLLHPSDFDAPEGDLEHLRGMPDCLAILLPAYPGHTQDDVDRLHRQAAWLAQTFPGRAWIGLNLLHRAFDDAHRAVIEEVSWQHGMRIVACGYVTMHVRSRKPLQDTMTAIRIGKPVAQCGYQLAPNAEQHLRSRVRLANIYPRAALDETVRIARLCTFSLDELRYEYPDEVVPPGHTAASYLREQTWIGAHRRFTAGIPAKVQAQIEHELALIAEMRYEHYFLTVYDIVRYARSQDILCQGRGSAANSAVCYCLGITEVDPARGNLLFERFISKERNEPPDIDVDFEHQRREEVIQYIYEKYGRERAAIAAVVICYRSRSALRDVGKAIGIDERLIDEFAKDHYWFDDTVLGEQLQRASERAGVREDELKLEHWIEMTRRLKGFPRHLSQHVGGFVLTHTRLTRLVPVEKASMKDRSVIQWEKDDLEAMGMLKVDVLALGMLSAIRRGLQHMNRWRGSTLQMHQIHSDDPKVFDMICDADTIGVFQIESRAQMSMLPRLKPRTYEDLVIEVAIVRPGPIQGGMVHPYLKQRERKRKGLEIRYEKDELRPALERTLGIPIFQEQVMQIAMIAAKFTADEADQLRRAMAAWKRKGGLDKFHDKLVKGMVDNEYPRAFAEAIFKQVMGFGDYGFPESHAASFALLVTVSSWLKNYEPACFLAALLDSQPMGFYSPSQLVQDARRHGVEVRPVDVTRSDFDTTLEARDPHAPRMPPGTDERYAERLGNENQPAVRLGLNRIASLSEGGAKRLLAARAQAPFTSTEDLALRAELEGIAVLEARIV